MGHLSAPNGYAVPRILRGAQFVRRQPGSRRAPMRVTPGAFLACGLAVPEHKHQWNIYRATERQGEPWSPAIDAHIRRFGAELLPQDGLLCIDCDQHLAVDGTVWLDGLRFLADAASVVGEILDVTGYLAVRTPGDPDRRHGPGSHLWGRPDPDYPVRFGPLGRCPAVEFKRRATAPGSPGYRPRYVPDQLPVIPRWLSELAGPPPAPATVPQRSNSGGSAWNRLHGIVERLVDERDRGERNRLLFWASARAGELVADGSLDGATAERVLVDAAAEIGLVAEDGTSAVLATVRSGLTRAGGGS